MEWGCAWCEGVRGVRVSRTVACSSYYYISHLHCTHTHPHTHTPSQQPDQSPPEIPASERNMRNRKAEDGYFKISRHFKWALTQAFDVMNYENVIIVEGEYPSDRFDQLYV